MSTSIRNNRQIISFHENPNQSCPVGRNIHHVLDNKPERVQKAMEAEPAAIKLTEVKEDIASRISKEQV